MSVLYDSVMRLGFAIAFVVKVAKALRPFGPSLYLLRAIVPQTIRAVYRAVRVEIEVAGGPHADHDPATRTLVHGSNSALSS